MYVRDKDYEQQLLTTQNHGLELEIQWIRKMKTLPIEVKC